MADQSMRGQGLFATKDFQKILPLEFQFVNFLMDDSNKSTSIPNYSDYVGAVDIRMADQSMCGHKRCPKDPFSSPSAYAAFVLWQKFVESRTRSLSSNESEWDSHMLSIVLCRSCRKDCFCCWDLIRVMVLYVG
ncbi:hypothetical protein O6H91_17G079700 [Diphasiastrum complanatum]|uniref:Uncharacterized protein n=1 Tax=Diphasiastrum complanatum TaxID=34168 RepID=A0ACC2B8G3_DIPCM|nr:hypothetical protein O6H91_17G079700 [Diphasiastrum complanatum]